MKKIYKLALLLVAAIAAASIYTSCSKDELPNNGEPVIDYVRVTDPLHSDSLLAGAFQGNLIAIVGENLQNVQQIWFNDQRATLTATYITNKTILVNVPSKVPTEVTNTLRMVFSNGKTLEHDFKLVISPPLVASMDSEYVLTGEVATIRGNYLYKPLTVTFTGGVTGEVDSIQDKYIKVTVPVGALPGPISIKTNFGETQSNFWFRDNRNIFISSDPFTGWWNASYVVVNPGPLDPPSINGNYIRIKKGVGAWAWTEVAGGPASAMGPISMNIPDDAILNPQKYNFKFEINTMKPYNNNVIKFNLGILAQNDAEYRWLPPYDSKGKWQTVIIPLSDIAAKQPLATQPSPTGYWCRVLMHGPGDLDADISFDNFRVVPIK